MLHFWCPVPVQVRTDTQACRVWCGVLGVPVSGGRAHNPWHSHLQNFMSQERVAELERQRAAVELEKVQAVKELQLQLDNKEREEDERRMEYELLVKSKEAELEGIKGQKAVSDAERDAMMQVRLDLESIGCHVERRC
jgi:hypothetical protein